MEYVMAVLGLDIDKDAMQKAVMCCTYGLGIITTLGMYGVIQERVMSMPYDGEMFKVSVFLVLCNRLWAILYAVMMVWQKGEEFGNTAPLWKYLAVSVSNVAATTCQYEALKWVSFPVQMLGKSFKMMPVMLWSIVISGKKYKAQDWLIAAGVTLGVTQFLMTGSIASKHADKGTSFYGLLLLLGFLGCDGFTSTFQEKLFSEHKTSKYNQMVYTNLGSAAISCLSLLALGSNGFPACVSFIAAHPAFLTHAMTLSAAAVAGQWFIYSQVKEFGALVFAATMNLRQVISICVSYLMYGHVITILQALGLCIVFGALFYKSYLGFVKEQASKQQAPVSQTDDSIEMGKPHPDTVGKIIPDPEEGKPMVDNRN